MTEKSSKIKHPMTKTRLKNQFLDLVGNPFNIIVLITLIILFCFIVIPLLTMIQNTFVVAKSDLRMIRATQPGAQIGDFTLYYWKYLLASPLTKTILWEPLLHSLIIGVSVTLISVPLGAVLAWLMVRSDLPGKGILSSLILVPYMVPSWCKSLAWLSVFRNSTSGSLGLLTGMGINIPDWLAYGPFAIILVMCMHYYAFAYIMVSGALRSINSELEEMGEIQGASKAQILKDRMWVRSMHASELPYLFDHQKFTDYGPLDRSLQARFSEMMIEFVKTGVPRYRNEGGELTAVPEYRTAGDERKTVIVGDDGTITVESDPWSWQRKLLQPVSDRVPPGIF